MTEPGLSVVSVALDECETCLSAELEEKNGNFFRFGSILLTGKVDRYPGEQSRWVAASCCCIA